jgi:preprotein translocase subunit SecA
MIEKALTRRVETALADLDPETEWDLSLLRQDLVMHYLLAVPEFEGDDPPTDVSSASRAAVAAAQAAYRKKFETLGEFGDQLLALVMLNVLDEKWKDHLYDLDQLRNAIHYRSWGQKDPLVEYKGEAYSMFVDLMHDIHHTFTERFLKAQIVFEQPRPAPQPVTTVRGRSSTSWG